MPYVDAALAFALSMLAIAILVNRIVMYAVAGPKREQAAKAIRTFAEKELLSLYTRQKVRIESRLGHALDGALESSLQDLRQRLKDASGDSPSVPAGDGSNELQSTNLHGQAIVSVTAEELVSLIKKTAFGKALIEAAKDQSDAFFDEVGERYDAFRNMFRAQVRKSARRWSVGIGIFVALALNINTFTLISVYISDPVARAAVIAKQTEITAMAEADLAKQCGQPGQENFDECVKNFDAKLEAIQKQVEDLGDTIPMGWEGKTIPEIWASFLKELTTNPVFYLLGCALTGWLAGLGTPFWYDTVKRIATFAQTVRTTAKSQSSGAGNTTGTGQSQTG